MANQYPTWTDAELLKAQALARSGASAAQIGAEFRLPGASVSPIADRSRGRRLLRLLHEHLPPESEQESEAPVGRQSQPTQEAPATGEAQPTARETPPSEERTETPEMLAIHLRRTRVKTLEQLLVECQVDTSRWEVERFACNKWEMGYLSASKEVGVQDLYQVKATFRAKKEEHNARVALESALETMRRHAPLYPMIQRLPHHPQEDLLFELSLPDVHVGKLAWGVECGEDYDLKIACDVFMDAFTALLSEARARPVSRIVFPVGNDLLNCDGPGGMTTGGTMQSNDGRYQKAYQRTLGLLVGAIDQLRELAPVEVLSIPGNHDTLSAWTITETLKAWYRTAGDVSVDNEPTLRKYRVHGRCLLGFTHGDKERPDDLPLLMAQQCPELWAQSRFREWHLGHLHKSATKIKTVGDEFHGVRVRTLPSLCASDVWHSQMGYVGNLRSAEGYFWHPLRGLAGTAVYTVV